MGTSEGFIYIYNLPNVQTCEYIVNHLEYVHSIKLCRDGIYKILINKNLMSIFNDTYIINYTFLFYRNKCYLYILFYK